MISPKVYVVIGVKNNWSYTKKVLMCIKKQTYKNVETIVIDDGSTDETEENLRKNYPDIIRLVGDGNLWWTGCMYKAVEFVLLIAKDNDYILTMNNDCTFDKKYIEKLVKIGRSRKNYVIGSLVLDCIDKKTVIDSGAKIEWLRGRIYRSGYNDISEIPIGKNVDEDIDTLTTRGTLFPVNIVRKVGNFDVKHLPHYASDFEYACRIKRMGFGLLVANDCIVYNDKLRTGSSGPDGKPISYNQFKKILFSRKSQVNIVDHFYLIYLCCPWYYQPINYLYLVGKFFYVVSFLKPIFPLRFPLVKLRELVLSK